MRNLTLTLVFFSFMVGACAKPQNNSRLNEKAEIEADADQKAKEKTALKMESDLARLQRFYQGTRGLFKGTVKTPSGRKFKVQFNLHPTVENYEGERIRTAEEINADLQRLAFDVGEQTSSVLSDGSDLALVCNYNDVKPGVERGLLYFHSEGCPRFFQVNIVPAGSAIVSNAQVLDQVSRSLSAELLSGEETRIDQLQVVMTTQNISTPMTFTMKRAD